MRAVIQPVRSLESYGQAPGMAHNMDAVIIDEAGSTDKVC